MNHSFLMFYLNKTVAVLNYYLNLKIPLQYFWRYFEKYSFQFFTSLTTSHYKLFPTPFDTNFENNMANCDAVQGKTIMVSEGQYRVFLCTQMSMSDLMPVGLLQIVGCDSMENFSDMREKDWERAYNSTVHKIVKTPMCSCPSRETPR